MGEIEPAKSSAPASAGGDSNYNRLQQRLKGFAEDMDMAKTLLDQLSTRIRMNASRAHDVASKAADTEFDKQPVALASAVSVALGGMGVDVKRLTEQASKVFAKAADAQTTHQRLYESLHHVRSRRKERTPKPGAFNRHS
ncbi:conjugal transfer protein TraB [Streptomyces sp. NPDC102487]|uniref:conjugal transfer protein TraB n=1 Tax=Streptomyces sp. NPDC102487 TaxID=3366182 RepID=UPI003811BB6B